MNWNFWTPVLGLFLMGMVVLWLVNSMWAAQSESVSYSEFKEMVVAGEIEEVTFQDEMLRATRAGVENAEMLYVVRVPGDEGLVALLEASDVSYAAQRPTSCDESLTLLIVAPLFLLLIFWLMMARREDGGRGAAAFGRSTAQLAPEEGTGVTFADVAGVEEAREELEEVVQFLQTPEKFTSLGGRPPKGVLLVGPPGTGKTLLARAVAGEAGVPFFSISGSAFVEMFVGVGAARVRDLFKQALEQAPCIIFIDELDAVGKSRGAGPAGNEEREQTLNQLLVEMDGFDNRKGIIVMAATNRPEILDPALLRAGRFDRQVLVDRPDLRGRRAILEVHSKKIKLSEDVDLEQVAKLTPGFAGADLANSLNEAALLAARREAKAVEKEDLLEAIERVVAGLERKSRRLSPREKRVIAYHECGHAICAAASPGADPVTKITIIPRGVSALGYTMYLPEEERHLQSKAELLNKIVTLFGGRAAEELVFGDVTSGAYDDIRRATDMARRMVTEFGMSKAIGAVNYAPRQSNAFGIGAQMGPNVTSPETAEDIEREVRRILDDCHKRAVDMLIENRVLLEEMSAYLIEREVLEGDIMNSYLDRAKLFDSLEDRPTGEWIPLDREGARSRAVQSLEEAPPQGSSAGS